MRANDTLQRTSMVLVLVLALVACGGGGNAPTPPNPTPPLVSASFMPSNADFPNPERGFYSFGADLSSLSEGTVIEIAGKGHRLVYVPNDLSAYKTQLLPQTYLQGLSNGFALLRKHGVKAVLRFAYTYPANEADYLNAKDATLAQAQAHITQLKPVLAANADVIAVWQAGFIGAWGEWHTSSNDLTSDANKLALRNSLLDALPAKRQLQVRYAGDFSKWFASGPTVADLLSSTPTLSARIGFHNDCFLASPDDVGTYFADTPTASTALRERMQAQTAVTASGGETCLPPEPTKARLSCEDILREGALYHLTYLNRDYYQGFFDSWQAGGCLADVQRKLGYRFVLKTLDHPQSAWPGENISVNINLENQGWARPMNDRSLQLRLIPLAGGTSVHLALPDTRLLAVGAGENRQWQASVRLPTGMAKGNYRVQVGAPDPTPSLQAQPIYAIRFANANQGQAVWDAASGFMGSGTQIEIH